MDQHAVFQRKIGLVNGALDKIGFGKYQWCIWLLCGMGYFIDLALVKSVALMASAVYQEMGVPGGRQGLISTCSNVGLAVGALGFGLLSDIIGRKWSFQITCLITAVFGMLMSASINNYGAICGIYFLACVGLGGNIPIDATVALEVLPQKRRNLVALMSMWQPIGVVAASGLAYGTAARYRCDIDLPACPSADDGEPCCSISSNMGWRYLVIIVGSMSLFIFSARFLLFSFHESPKWLVSKGREQEAIDVLHKIAKFNGVETPTLTMDDFHRVDIAAGLGDQQPQAPNASAKDVTRNMVKSLGFLRGLFLNRRQCFSFVLLGLSFMGNYWSFTLAGYFLPIVLLRNNVDSGAHTVTDTYQQYIYIYLPGILGAVAALITIQIPLLGRKWSLVVSASLQGLSMALYTQVKTTAGYVGLNALEYIMQSYFNAVLYSAAPEMFDTTYRASASGMLSCLGRIAGIVAPFAGQKYIDEGRAGVLWLGAGGIWLAALLLCFLPIEMRGRQMY
ncbi:major facilitator superfamily domain-containing protein [Aspergillus karnatakaensis]|uniref:major facilitator superfamily domain-containing protein n=1 Tax=Aspergillus karnatakaensis TaxID=1810916 RepID=UPI003CCE0B2F